MIAKAGERLIAIVGNYGSGKTEVAIHLAVHLADRGVDVYVADLDLVNPYFRCREAVRLMEAHNIKVVVPPGERAMADLPILLPEVRGMLRPPSGAVSIFDVGGDDVGARVLSTFRTDLAEGGYELWQVLNGQRPFTQTVEGCLAVQREIEASSRLRMTGLVSNSHMIEETDAETILGGWRLALRVSERNGLPIRLVTLPPHLEAHPALAGIDAPRLVVRRTMLPPWLPPGQPVPLGGRTHGSHRD